MPNLTGTLEPRLVPLDDLIALERNPKDHDIGELSASMDRFGFLERILVNETTGRTLAGHGRIDTLKIKRQRGAEPPDGVVIKDNVWLVPADFTNVKESEEEAVAIALNKLTERGGWNEQTLFSVLSDLANQGEHMLSGIGFDLSDVDVLREQLEKEGVFDIPDEELENYALDGELEGQWLVLVECLDESEQLALLDELMRKGHKVKALMG